MTRASCSPGPGSDQSSKGDAASELLGKSVLGGGQLTDREAHRTQGARCLASIRFGDCLLVPIFTRHERDFAHRILVRARKGSRAPLRLHRGLCLTGADGSESAQARAILRDGLTHAAEQLEVGKPS